METQEKNQDKSAQKGSVLLIDDDKFLLDMYAMKFTQQGYLAHGCLSVKDGLNELAKGFQADAVVFDLIMPERDGFSLLEALRDQHLSPRVAKIALTNQMEDSDRNRATELGADLFIVKASSIPSEVVNIVASEIEKRRAA